MARTTPMRIEPKTFFANERTFLSWLHMAVTIGSIAAALLGFAGVSDSHKKSDLQVTLHILTCSSAVMHERAILCHSSLPSVGNEQTDVLPFRGFW